MLSNITRSTTAKGLKLSANKLTILPVFEPKGLFVVTHSDILDGAAIIDENFKSIGHSGFSFAPNYVPFIVENIARVRKELDFVPMEYEFTTSPCKNYFLRVPLYISFLKTFRATNKYTTFISLFKALQNPLVKDLVSDILKTSLDLIRLDFQSFDEVYI